MRAARRQAAIAAIIPDGNLRETKMFTRKVLVSALFAAGMLGAAAMPQTSIAAIDVYVNVAPPAERYERVPEVRRGYVWSPGYWDYRHDKHVWVKGSSVRERHGYAYEPNRWVERDGRWNLERSRWNKAHRDNDHDGIPNNRDSQPNNPNRR
jgi:YXWGXW repeat-containing protein